MSAGPDSPTPSSDNTAPAIDPAAPIVPRALVPGVEQPARRRRAPVWRSLGVLVLVVLALAALLALAGSADDRWGPEAMTVKAIHGVEALVRGDTASLLAAATPAGRATLTPAALAAIRRSGAPATFTPIEWVGGSAEVTGTIGSNTGRLVAAPDPGGASVVTFELNGALTNAIGAVSMERDWGGWLIAGFELKTVDASGTPPASQP